LAVPAYALDRPHIRRWTARLFFFATGQKIIDIVATASIRRSFELRSQSPVRFPDFGDSRRCVGFQKLCRGPDLVLNKTTTQTHERIVIDCIEGSLVIQTVHSFQVHDDDHYDARDFQRPWSLHLPLARISLFPARIGRVLRFKGNEMNKKNVEH